MVRLDGDQAQKQSLVQIAVVSTHNIIYAKAQIAARSPTDLHDCGGQLTLQDKLLSTKRC